MNNKIKLAITALVGGTSCNLDCEYCYRKGQGIKDRNTPAKFNYSVEHMLKALSKERLGGNAIICICGGGETLLPAETVPLIKGLLKEGHVVDLISNLTLNKKIDELLDTPKEDLKRLILKASFHYLELKRLNKLEDYFYNFNRLINAGASGSPILTIYEEYIPLLDEIKNLCLEKINDLPHVTCAIDNFNTTMNPREFYKPDFVNKVKEQFDSNVFTTFDELLKDIPQKHFCYTGEWNFVLNLENGDVQKCFYAPVEQNIFKDIKSKIKYEPIGHNCPKPNCALNYNWHGMGIIPELNIMTYSKMLARKNTYSPEILEMLDFKFSDFEKTYNEEEKIKISQCVKDRYSQKKPLTLKNRLRLKIYNHLKKKLEKKGLL